MRFSVEEINNSTDLLPNISLGYDIFDHCSDTRNFPGILDLISVNNQVKPWEEPHKNLSKVIAVVGTYTSTETRTVAPLFMMDLIPMVSYGAASSAFSRKQTFPSFFRTVHPNQDVIEVIVHLVQHFNWRWVAFLNVDDDYGNDGRDLFIKKIAGTKICLAYTKGLNFETNHNQIYQQIQAQRIRVIIVFAPEYTAEPLIEAAIRLNITNKVWIAGDAWSLNKKLPKVKGIRTIGTILGVAESRVAIPGFRDFIYSLKSQNHCESAGRLCNKVAAELKKSNFTLLNQNIHFNENGDPMAGVYSIVYWNHSGDAVEVGFYKFPPSPHFFVNGSKIRWHTDGEVPTSVCSPECPVGHAKKQDGIHECCFSCVICPNGTYLNITEDPYKCIECKETEWSEDGSTSCSLRSVEYITFTDTEAILLMGGAGVLVGLIVAMSVLFAINYNTPVVRSAGGPMCFLILGCLSLCSLSVFFYFDKPTASFCTLRFLPFILFYTVCQACFVVRSFQIVCIFKIAAKFPKLHSWWMKYHGQWLVIMGAFFIQAILLLGGYTCEPPRPYNETLLYPDTIILSCDVSLAGNSGSVILLLSLSCLCFIFSYMGKDLPKNYNEAKAITFCLLLLILTWIIFATVAILYHGKYIQLLNALAVLSSLYSFLLWYFLPKCYIIIFQPQRNTQQYFQGLIQNYTKTISQ
ncbi:hypothetical protein INR49_021807 [Caranx melampygus]|nr:hypothetical protein INR49_021807 [Caranx melampygus]